jgi:hypothetical protein
MKRVRTSLAPVKPEDFAPLLRGGFPDPSTQIGPAQPGRAFWVGIPPGGPYEPDHTRDKERHL